MVPDLKDIKAKFDELAPRVAKKRDEFRELQSELQALADSLEQGVDNLQDAVHYFNEARASVDSAIDALSTQV